MVALVRFHYAPLVGFGPLFSDAFTARTQSYPIVVGVGGPRHLMNRFHPRINLFESDASNTVSATLELPGLTREDIAIDLQENRLTISGASPSTRASQLASDEQGPERDGYVLRERRGGTFSRTLQIPLGTKAEDVKAKLENGLLTVTFPKKAPEQATQRIAIQSLDRDPWSFIDHP